MRARARSLSAGGVNRTHTLQYAYNPTTGQLTSITYPSGRIIGLQYGATSKDVETVTVDGQPVASAVTYHPFGGIKRMKLRNGLVWSSAVDQDGRITSYTLGGVTYSIQWDRRQPHRRHHASDRQPLESGYAYDGLDRIASFVSRAARPDLQLRRDRQPAPQDGPRRHQRRRSRTPTTSRRPATG